MPGWLSTTWYEVCRCHIMAGLTLGFSLRFEGGRNIPTEGAALLIANHESFLDPIAVGLTTTRQLCYLARKTLFSSPRSAASFPVSVACPSVKKAAPTTGLRSFWALSGQAGRWLFSPRASGTPTDRRT